MSVRLRLKRMGARHRPSYRLAAVDQRRKRDGRVIEPLGYYNPLARDESRQLQIDSERCRYWLSVGAQPSRTVSALLRRQGVNPNPGKETQAT